MAHYTNNGAASAAPTRRALLGGAGIAAAIAASPVLASLPPVSVFDRRLTEWKRAREHYLAVCATKNVSDSIVNHYCGETNDAYLALLAAPAPDARSVLEKLVALAVWSKDCVIEEDEVEALAAEAATLLKGGR